MMALGTLPKKNQVWTGMSQPALSAGSTPISGRERLILAGILLAALVVYLRCLGNGFVWDDDALILSNPYIGQWSFLWKSLIRPEYWFIDWVQQGRYRPLFSIWLALSYHLFGFKPAGWHALAVAVHLVAVWLVFKVGLGLTERRESALLAAALFALLPVHAHAVVWAAASCDVLAGTFALAAFYFFMRREDGRLRNWSLALALYAAALFSHESAAAFPGLVAWYVFLLEPGTEAGSTPTRFGVRVSRAFFCAAPFALEVVLYLYARRHAVGFMLADPSYPANVVPISQIYMTVPAAFGTYLMLLAAPWMAGPAHRLDIVTGPASPGFYIPVMALVALAAALSAAVWRSPRRRLYLFCAGWIPIALSPVMDLHVLVKDQFITDGYLYLASAGWCVLLADWVTGLAERGAVARRLVWAAASVLLASYAAALWNVQRYYHDEATVFARCIELYPQSWTCRFNLGNALYSLGDLEGAAREFRISVSQSGQTPYLLGQGFSNLGAVYEDQGDLNRAEQALGEALRFNRQDSVALYRLGMAHGRLGRDQEAVGELSAALERMHDPPAAGFVMLAEVYDAQGNLTHRDEVLERARSLPDGDKAVGLAYARIKARHGDLKGAGDVLHDLVRRYPDDSRSWIALGLLLADDNRGEESLSAFGRAQQLSPRDPEPHFFAARVLHAMGRDRDALQQCRRALDIAPAHNGARSLQDEILRQSAGG